MPIFIQNTTLFDKKVLKFKNMVKKAGILDDPMVYFQYDPDLRSLVPTKTKTN